MWAVARGVRLPALPGAGMVSVRRGEEWPAGFMAEMGWVAAGPLLVRLDVAERVVAELAYATRRERAVVPMELASRLGIGGRELPAVLHGLGVRLAPPGVLEAGQYGPPAPAMALPPRRAKVVAPVAVAPRGDNAFAALGALRR